MSLMKAKPKSSFTLFFERRAVRALLGVVSLLLAYVFASWAIDSGSLLDYAITVLLIVVGVRELYAASRKEKLT